MAFKSSVGNYAIRKISALNDNEFSVETKDCTKAGSHTITLKSVRGEDPNKVNFEVKANGFNVLKMQDKVDSDNFIKGGSQNGDYISSDVGENLTFSITTQDEFGNNQDIGSDPTVISKALGITSTYPEGREGNVDCSGSNGSYKIVVHIKEVGKYSVNFTYPKPSRKFFFNILPGAPRVEKSLLAITGATKNPVVKFGDKVTTSCKFVDSLNNVLKGDDVKNVHGGVFTCQVVRRNVAGKETVFDGQVVSTASGFDCVYTPVAPGTYTVSGKISIKNGVPANVPSGVSSFVTTQVPTDLANSKIFDPINETWNDIGNNEIKIKPSSPFLFMLDFFTKEEGSLATDNGKFLSDSFDIKTLTAKVSAEDNSDYSEKVTVEAVTVDGKKYFSFKCGKEDYFKKTSGYYFVDISLGTSTKQVKMRYPLINTNGETVCIGDLSPGNTEFAPTENLPKITMNVQQDVKIGDIKTRTASSCLYNYWAELNRFNSNVEGYYIKKDDSVEGYYELRLNTNKSGTNWMECTLDDYDFVGGYEVTVQSEPIISSFQPIVGMNKFKSGTILEDQSNDKDVLFYFKGLDGAGNPLDLNPAAYNKFVGLSMTHTINGQTRTSTFAQSKTSGVKYDRAKSCYIITDYYKESGNYEVSIAGKNKSKPYKFSYYKKPGVTSLSNSLSNVLSDPEIVIAKTAQIGLNLNDAFNNDIGADKVVSELERAKVKVQAVSEDGATVINFAYSKTDNSNMLYDSPPIKRSCKFLISVSYNGQAMKCTSRCEFNVRYGDIFIKNTQANIILSSTKSITEGNAELINNINDVPVYSLKFFDDGQNWIGKIDFKKDTFAASIVGKNFEIALDTETLNDNELHLMIPQSRVKDLVNAVKGDYSLNVSYKGNKGLSYPLKMLGDGQDSDAGNGEKDVSKTVIDTTLLKAVAGDSVNVRIVLNTADSLRVNKFEDLSMFTIQNSNVDDKSFKWSVQNGNKKGTYIFSFTSTVKSFPSSNILTISIGGVKVPTSIQYQVLCSVMSSCKFDDNVISDKAGKFLLENSTVGSQTCTLKCFDKFGNGFDPIFDNVAYSSARVINLFSFSHSTGANVFVDSVKDILNNNFGLIIKTRETGIITITSIYLDGAYKMNVVPGPASSLTSFINVVNTELKAGDKVEVECNFRDKYSNVIALPRLTQEEIKGFSANTLKTKPNEERVLLAEDRKDEKKNTVVGSVKLTSSGDHVVQAQLNGEPLKCDKCALKVQIGPIDYTKSKLVKIVDGKSFACSEKIGTGIPQGSNPTFLFNLYDGFQNKVEQNDMPKNAVYEATFMGTDKKIVNLCSKVEGATVVVNVCDDPKSQNDWKYLISRAGYNLYVKQTITNSNALPQTMAYPMTITGGEDNSDASNADMDIRNTYFSTKSITATAGDVSTFYVEIRTGEGKRRNFWYISDDSVRVLFKNNNTGEWYTRSVVKGSKPGQYTCKVSSTKDFPTLDGNLIQLEIDGQLCTNTSVVWTVNPGSPIRGEIRDTMNSPIESLPEGNADLIFGFNVVLFDKFNNKARINPEEFNYTFVNPENAKKSSTITRNDDGYSFRISAWPQLTGVWSFSASLINGGKPFTFSVYPGEPSHVQTSIVCPKEMVAGKKLECAVVLYDAYANLIDPRNVELNPVQFMYKQSIAPGKFANYVSSAQADARFQFRAIAGRTAKGLQRPLGDIKDFVLTLQKNQEVWIKTKTGKCLSSQADKLVVSDCSDANKMLLSYCADSSYIIQNANKKCLKESNNQLVEADCDCSKTDQNFIPHKNFDRSFFIQNKLSQAWTVNQNGEVNFFGLQGGNQQIFYISNVAAVQSVFNAENGKSGEVGCILYDFTFTTATDFVFRATVQNNEVKCDNCALSVKPDVEDFKSFYIERFASTNKFTEMADSFNEDNTKADPIYRLYARDQFKNLISTIAKDGYSMRFVDSSVKKYAYVLKSSANKDTSFVEFIKNDDKKVNDNLYENLVAGNYTLEITSKTANTPIIIKKVKVLGSGSEDEDSSNDPLDIQKTVIRESKLNLVAMETGYLIIKLQTINDMRKNEWGAAINLESTSSDDKFTFNVKNAGKKGVYYISFSTDRANNFYPAFENNLVITVNGVVVKTLSPKLDISPAEINDCAVLPEQRQDDSTIREGTADAPLTFELACKDKYNNICNSVFNMINLVVKDSKGFEIITTATLDRVTGRGRFISNTTVSGDYTVSGNNSFLKNTYKYVNKPGVLFAENIVKQQVRRELVAGTDAELVITPRDKNKNIIPATLVKDRFEVNAKTKTGLIVKTVPEVKNDNIVFRAMLKQRDINEFTVSCDKKISESPEIAVNVIPGAPNLKNMWMNTSSLSPEQKDKTITKSNQYLTESQLYLRDNFDNLISEIDTTKYQIVNARITGLNTDPIIFNVNKCDSDDCLNLSNKDYYSIRKFSRLIGNDKKGYLFEYTIKGNGAEETYKYPLNIKSCRDDTGRGNGEYVAANTEFSAAKVSFVAGDTASFDIILKTSEKLIYNDGVNIAETFKWESLIEDSELKVEINKKGYASGIYAVTVRTTKIFAKQNILTFSVKEKEAKEWTKLKDLTINVEVMPKMPPNTDLSKFTNPPETMTAGTPFKFTFKIFDFYGNAIVDRSITNYLILFNNKVEIPSNTELNEDGSYTLTATIQYPPRNASLQVFYKQNNDMAEINNTVFSVFLESTSYDPKKSKIRGSKLTKMDAGDVLDVSIWLYDANGKCMDVDKPIDIQATCNGPKNHKYQFKLVKNPTLNECMNSYQIIVDENNKQIVAGKYKCSITVGGSEWGAYDQTVDAGPADKSKFLLSNVTDTNYAKVPAGTSFTHRLVTQDAFGNVVNNALTPLTKFRVMSRKDGNYIELKDNRTITYSEKTQGQLEVTVSVNTIGTYYLAVIYNGEELANVDRTKSPATFTVIPLECSGQFTEYDNSRIEKATVSSEAILRFSTFDRLGNKLIVGGCKTSCTVTLASNPNEEVNAQVRDEGDGSYRCAFIPLVEDTYQVQIKVGESLYGTKIAEFKISNPECKGATPIRCIANPSKCVSDIKKCATKGGDNDCPSDEPFFCDRAKETVCTKSQTKCDCKEGYFKADRQPFCVKKELVDVVTPLMKNVDCGDNAVLCNDGTCRVNLNQCPNKYGNPVGYVQCPNLTWETELEKCTIVAPQCKDNEVRCSDQTCNTDYSKCASTITCPKVAQIVCPGPKGELSCQDSELTCGAPKKCPPSAPVLCTNNQCATKFSTCQPGIVCGPKLALGVDGVCKSIINADEVVPEVLTAQEIAILIQPKAECEAKMRELKKINDAKIKAEEQERLEETARQEKVKVEEKFRVDRELTRVQEAERTKKADDEKARLLGEKIAKDKKDRDEEIRIAKEEEVKRAAAVEVLRKKLEADELTRQENARQVIEKAKADAQKIADDAIRRAAEAEAAAKAAAEVVKKAAEELATRLRLEAEAREKKRAEEEENRKRAEAIAAAAAAEKERLRLIKEAEDKRLADEARRKAEEEAARRAAAAAAALAAQVQEAARIARINVNRQYMEEQIYSRGVPFYSTKGTQCFNGRSMKLIHWNTLRALHSHGNRYWYGDRNQEVTCFWARDDNDWFTIRNSKGNDLSNGAEVEFLHNSTQNSIYTQQGSRSPMTGQLEASGRRNTNNDSQFFWRIEQTSWYGDSFIRVGDFLRLVNVGNNCTLHSHGINLNAGTSQQEVTGFCARDSNDMWIVVQCT